MATFKLSTYHARVRDGESGFSVVFHLDGKPRPFPERMASLP